MSLFIIVIVMYVCVCVRVYASVREHTHYSVLTRM